MARLGRAALDDVLEQIRVEYQRQVDELRGLLELAEELNAKRIKKGRDKLLKKIEKVMAYGTDDDGDPINPDIEEALTFIQDNGAPDPEEISEHLKEVLEEALASLSGKLEELSAIRSATPHDGFVSVPITDDDDDDEDEPPPPRSSNRGAPPAVSGDRFAQDVLAVLPAVKTQVGPSGMDKGRYGAESVFIWSAWQRLRSQRPYEFMSLDEFKQRLLEANRNGRLSLVRADLVDDMDPQEVELSEIDDGYGTFHFILDPSAG